MGGVFDQKEKELAAPRRDTELTLGLTALLSIFFGLLLLCGLCFGLGYAAGRRGTQETSAAPAPAGGGQAAAPGAGERPKPEPNQQASVADKLPEPSTQQVGGGPDAAPSIGQALAAVDADGPAKGPPEVKPAFETPQAPASGRLPQESALALALAPAGSVMVQIAAVSQQEDADVLMTALRKRGYAVTSRRDPLDGLIHVRTGPFKTRADAETWRQKLLNDGYNAIVQP